MPPDDRRTLIATIAAQHGRRLRRFLTARVRNAADVPDIVQEVYLRLLRIGRIEIARSPEAYVFTVASHLLYEHTLRQSTAPVTVEFGDVFTELETQDSDPLDHADTEQRVQQLERAARTLPAKALIALVLSRRDGYTLDEIAKKLGVSRPMAKKYLARALKHCRQNLVTE